jgi:hypothetical protein
MTRPRSLPPGVRLWIWPRWRVEVGDRAARLSPAQGRLLALYLSDPRRAWTPKALVRELYGDQEDGGPLNTQVTFFVTARGLSDRLARHGIVLDLERSGSTRRFRELRADGPVPERAARARRSPSRPPPRPGPPPPPRRPAAPPDPVPDRVLAAPWSVPERVEEAGRRSAGPDP